MFGSGIETNQELDMTTHMTLEESVKSFLEFCEIGKNQSLKTIENYTHYLRRFLEWFDSKDPADITLDKIHEYRLYLNRYKDKRGRALSKKTQNYHIIALRSLLKFLTKRDVKTLSPDKIELGKDEQRVVDFLNFDEMQMMFKAIDLSSNTGFRDRAILELLFSTGLRIGELVNLDRDHIDLERGEFTVRGKGGKLRLVFMSPDATSSIKNYMMTRDDNWKPLFINMRRSKDGKDFYTGEHKRLTAYSIQEMVRKTALKAGIIKKVTPHTIRHSFATNLLMNGADIRSVQELLGHASITTTQIYTHITNQKLRETHKLFHRQRGDYSDAVESRESLSATDVDKKHSHTMAEDIDMSPDTESDVDADFEETEISEPAVDDRRPEVERPLQRLKEVEENI